MGPTPGLYRVENVENAREMRKATSKQSWQLRRADVSEPGGGSKGGQLVEPQHTLLELQLLQGELAAVELGKTGQYASHCTLCEVHVLAHIVYSNRNGGGKDKGLEVDGRRSRASWSW